MRNNQRFLTPRRAGVAIVITISLVAAACSDKKDEETVGTESPSTEPADPSETTQAVITPPPTEAPIEAKTGGTLRVAGEAEVGVLACGAASGAFPLPWCGRSSR